MSQQHVPFRVWVILLEALFLGAVPATGLQRPDGAPKSPALDACALLTSSEVQRVQGEATQDAKAGNDQSGALLVRQCLFRTTTPIHSVSLAIALPNPAASGDAISPRTFWQSKFHSPENEKEKRGESGEPEGSNPRPVPGIGDEAFWVGTSMTGALYVLKGNLFLRISAGGIRDEASRIEHSKTLAALALKRLSDMRP
ncbi:MAG TPA: hypothetical protein VF018_03805 [Acidobacteriaceae bacterium]